MTTFGRNGPSGRRHVARQHLGPLIEHEADDAKTREQRGTCGVTLAGRRQRRFTLAVTIWLLSAAAPRRRRRSAGTGSGSARLPEASPVRRQQRGQVGPGASSMTISVSPAASLGVELDARDDAQLGEVGAGSTASAGARRRVGFTCTRASSDLWPAARNGSSWPRIASRRGRISSVQRLFGSLMLAPGIACSTRTSACTSKVSPVARAELVGDVLRR